MPRPRRGSRWPRWRRPRFWPSRYSLARGLDRIWATPAEALQWARSVPRLATPWRPAPKRPSPALAASRALSALEPPRCARALHLLHGDACREARGVTRQPLEPEVRRPKALVLARWTPNLRARTARRWSASRRFRARRGA